VPPPSRIVMHTSSEYAGVDCLFCPIRQNQPFSNQALPLQPTARYVTPLAPNESGHYPVQINNGNPAHNPANATAGFQLISPSGNSAFSPIGTVCTSSKGYGNPAALPNSNPAVLPDAKQNLPFSMPGALYLNPYSAQGTDSSKALCTNSNMIGASSRTMPALLPTTNQEFLLTASGALALNPVLAPITSNAVPSQFSLVDNGSQTGGNSYNHYMCELCLYNQISRSDSDVFKIKCGVDKCNKMISYINMINYIKDAAAKDRKYAKKESLQNKIAIKLIPQLIEKMGVATFIFSLNLGNIEDMRYIKNYAKNINQTANSKAIEELESDLKAIMESMRRKIAVGGKSGNPRSAYKSLYRESLDFSKYSTINGDFEQFRLKTTYITTDHKRDFCYAKIFYLLSDPTVSTFTMSKYLLPFDTDEIECKYNPLVDYIREYKEKTPGMLHNEEAMLEFIAKTKYDIKLPNLQVLVDKYLKSGTSSINRICGLIYRIGPYFVAKKASSSILKKAVSNRKRSANDTDDDVFKSSADYIYFRIKLALNVTHFNVHDYLHACAFIEKISREEGQKLLAGRLMELTHAYISTLTDKKKIDSIIRSLVEEIRSRFDSGSYIELDGVFDAFTSGLVMPKIDQIFVQILPLLADLEFKLYILPTLVRHNIIKTSKVFTDSLRSIEHSDGDFVFFNALLFYLVEYYVELEDKGVVPCQHLEFDRQHEYAMSRLQSLGAHCNNALSKAISSDGISSYEIESLIMFACVSYYNDFIENYVSNPKNYTVLPSELPDGKYDQMIGHLCHYRKTVRIQKQQRIFDMAIATVFSKLVAKELNLESSGSQDASTIPCRVKSAFNLIYALNPHMNPQKFCLVYLKSQAEYLPMVNQMIGEFNSKHPSHANQQSENTQQCSSSTMLGENEEVAMQANGLTLL